MNDAVKQGHELSSPPPPYYIMQQWHDEDTISLVDLWRALAKRRAIIIASILIALMAGLALAFLLPQKYNYSSSIEIGSTLEPAASGEEVRLIASPESALAKIRESFIPLVQQEYRAAHPDDNSVYEIDARNPEGSLLILLEASGSQDVQAPYLEHIQQVTHKLLEDHQRVMDIYHSRLNTRLRLANIELDKLSDPATLATEQRRLESEINKARLRQAELTDPRILTVPRQALENKLAQNRKKLVDLKDQASLIKSSYQRLDETDDLLKQQISELEAHIKSALSQRERAIGNIRTESAAMSMLLIDNNIQQNRMRLATLQERLYIDQQNLRETLEEKIASNLRAQEVQVGVINKAQSELSRFEVSSELEQQRQKPEIARLEAQLDKLVADNRRAVEQQKQQVNTLQTQLDNTRPTRVITQPVQSLEPTGPSKSMIMAVALILGAMLGVFLAFFAIFLQKVEQQDS